MLGMKQKKRAGKKVKSDDGTDPEKQASQIWEENIKRAKAVEQYRIKVNNSDIWGSNKSTPAMGRKKGSIEPRSVALACFAIDRCIYYSNLRKRIDKQVAQSGHPHNRFFSVASKGEISIMDG